MAFQLSPGVEINEVDLTTIVPAVATTKAGMAGLFEWGPVGQRITVDSENALVSTFRKPNNQNFPYWFTAANYLSYGRDLQVVRVIGSTSRNATNTGAGYSIVRNSEELPSQLINLEGENVVFLAKYPGALGNSIGVSISDKTNTQADQEETGSPPSPPGGGGSPPSPPGGGGSPPSPPGGGGSPPSPPGGSSVTYTYETINRVFSRGGLENNARNKSTGEVGPRGTAKFAITDPNENWSDFDRVCVNTQAGEEFDGINTFGPEHHYIYLPKLPTSMIPPSTHGQNFDSTRVGKADTSNNMFPCTRAFNFPSGIQGPLPKVDYDGAIISAVDPIEAETAPAGTTGNILGSSHIEPIMLYLDMRELNPASIDANLDFESDYWDLPSWNGRTDNATYNDRREAIENILYHPNITGSGVRSESNIRLSQLYLVGDDAAWPENLPSIIDGGTVFNALNENGLSYVVGTSTKTCIGPIVGGDPNANVYSALRDLGATSRKGCKPPGLCPAASNEYYVINTHIGRVNGNVPPNPPMRHDIGTVDIFNVVFASGVDETAKHPNVRKSDGTYLRMTPEVAGYVSLFTGIPDTVNFPEFYSDPSDPTTWNGQPVPQLTIFQNMFNDSTVMGGPRASGTSPSPNNYTLTNWDYPATAYTSTFDKIPIWSGKIKGAAEIQTLAAGGGPFGVSVFAFLPEIFEATGIHGGQAGNNIGFARIPQNGFKYYEGRPAMLSKPTDITFNLGGSAFTFLAGSGRYSPGPLAAFEQLAQADFISNGNLKLGERSWFTVTFEEGGFGLAKGDINYEYKLPFVTTLAGDPSRIKDEDGAIIHVATRVNRIPLMFAGHFHASKVDAPGADIPSDGDGRLTVITATENSNSTFAPPSSSFNAVDPDGSWRYSGLFETQLPASSSFADRFNVSNDLMHMVVFDRTGDISGTVGTVLERFGSMSKAPNAKKFDGSNNYYKNVINENSKWVSIAKTPGTTSAGLPLDTVIDSAIADGTFASVGTKDYNLSGGTDVSPAGGDFYTDGYDQFADPQTVDISLILGGPLEGIQAKQIVEMCDRRKDAVAFISPAKTAVLTSTNSPKSSSVATANAIAYRKGVNANSSGGDTDYSNNNVNVSSSYGFLDSGWKYMYDRYNDVLRFVPMNGDMGGLAARSDDIAEPWFSPAGFNRGQVRNVVKLAFNPVQTQRDNLYSSQINSVCSFPGEGTVLFGDKTMQSKPSAFDRLNVRRLFIVIEKAIATASKFSLFEQNDAFTRASFRQLIEPFLRDVQSRRGIQDFKVVCDESNNTGEVIDRNEFVADIFIKPTRSINYITLNFIATRTDVSFDEIGGSV
jgi:hypothetical protein